MQAMSVTLHRSSWQCQILNPGTKPTSSCILVGFVTTGTQWELLLILLDLKLSRNIYFFFFFFFFFFKKKKENKQTKTRLERDCPRQTGVKKHIFFFFFFFSLFKRKQEHKQLKPRWQRNWPRQPGSEQ